MTPRRSFLAALFGLAAAPKARAEQPKTQLETIPFVDPRTRDFLARDEWVCVRRADLEKLMEVRHG